MTLALLIGVSLAAGGLDPREPAQLDFSPRSALAADTMLESCDEASFDAALADVQSNGGGTITIDCDDPIGFTTQKVISSDVELTGNGAILDGGNITRLFQVDPGASMKLTGLTLRNGRTDSDGGAIYNEGTLTISASTFTGNKADSIGGRGGAIFSSHAAVEVTASTFNGNRAVSNGGAILIDWGTLRISTTTFSGNRSDGNGGAVDNQAGTLTISASTFEGNTSRGNGGAILSIGTPTKLMITASTFTDNTVTLPTGWGGAVSAIGGQFHIVASTFSGNGASNGGAISSSSATVTVSSSILADSTSGSNCIGTVVSLGYNLSDDTSCNLVAAGDQQGPDVAIGLGPVMNSGGPTATMLPLTGSAAIEAIPAADCLTYSSTPDQRGVTRPNGTHCEIGAVELGQLSVQIVDFPGVVIDEGGTATLPAIAYGPDNDNLVYRFDCDHDDDYETPGNGNQGACSFSDDGSFTVGVEVCDATETDVCAIETSTVTVRNVAPTITAITHGPVTQGQPVIVTVSAIDPGIYDILSYSFDCDNDGIYETVGSGSQGACTLDPASAVTTIGVQVSDDDLGVTIGSVEVHQTLALCANRYTGELGMPASNGSCPSGSIVLTLPAPSATTLCISAYTGAITWSSRGTCGVGGRVHLVPDDGPLHYCRSLYTGKLRYSATGVCGASERPGVIPG